MIWSFTGIEINVINESKYKFSMRPIKWVLRVNRRIRHLGGLVFAFAYRTIKSPRITTFLIQFGVTYNLLHFCIDHIDQFLWTSNGEITTVYRCGNHTDYLHEHVSFLWFLLIFSSSSNFSFRSRLFTSNIWWELKFGLFINILISWRLNLYFKIDFYLLVDLPNQLKRSRSTLAYHAYW